MNLSPLDRSILDLLQNQFPVSVQPYRDLADMLGISEEQLLQRVAALKQQGIIRRIGGVINSKGLGYYSTLLCCHMPPDQMEKAVRRINSEPGVTHNYLRKHDLNLWFTLTAPSQQQAAVLIEKLRTDLGVEILSMPALKTYKIRLTLPMGGEQDA